MKKSPSAILLLTFLILSELISCRSNPDQKKFPVEKSNKSNDTSIIHSQAEITKNVFKILDSSLIEHKIRYTGKIVKRIRWIDAGGEKTFMLTYADTAMDSVHNGASVLSEYYYNINGNSEIKILEKKIKTPYAPLETIWFHTLCVEDNDKNDSAEIYLTYSWATDGLDADTLYTAVINMDQQYGLITGPVFKPDQPGKSKRKYNKAFLAMPDVIKKRALKEWEKECRR
jgi:hypothetical protein